MNGLNANTLVLTTLADVCWLLNIRGDDVAFNPYVYGYVVIDPVAVHFFVHEGRIDTNYFKDVNVILHPYDSFSSFIKELHEKKDVKLCFDKKDVSFQLSQDVADMKPLSVLK